MAGNIKAFMRADISDEKRKEIPGIDAFMGDNGEPEPFVIRNVPRAEMVKITELFTRTRTLKTDKGKPYIVNGEVQRYDYVDQEAVGNHLIAVALVSPSMYDNELLEFYGCKEADALVRILFNNTRDRDYILGEIIEFSKLGSEPAELMDEAKNS